MSQINTTPPAPATETGHAGVSRRRFLGVTGLLLGAGALSLQSCSRDDPKYNTNPNPAVDLGSGDIGVLNYAYALEQLEAAFYTQVIATPYSNIGSEEMAMLKDIRDHEIAHREFFKAAIGKNAIRALEVDFSTIDFSSRESVLTTARAFEDLGVQAYNGAGMLLASTENLILAGKIVSVEARHAAYIRELLVPGSFADTTILVPTTRGDYAKTPTEVLAIAGKYIKTKIDASYLPTS